MMYFQRTGPYCVTRSISLAGRSFSMSWRTGGRRSLVVVPVEWRWFGHRGELLGTDTVAASRSWRQGFKQSYDL